MVILQCKIFGAVIVHLSINRSPGFTLLLRRKAAAQNLQRGIRFNPAAIGQFTDNGTVLLSYYFFNKCYFFIFVR